MMMKNICLCLLLSLLSLNLQGQNFQQITTSNGLPDSHARFFYQDSYGYMWVGTRTSLCKYDGYDFDPINFDSIDKTKRPREFSAIIEDVSGDFHLVASTGLFLYSPERGEVTLTKELTLYDKACFIQYGNMLLCGNSSGLFIFSSEVNSWIVFEEGGADFLDHHVKTMAIVNEKLLVGSNKGLFEFSEGFSKIKHIGTFEDVNGIIWIKGDEYWVSSPNNLYMMNGGVVLKDYSDLFDEKILRCMTKDDKGAIWVGGQFGIKVIDCITSQVKTINRAEFEGTGLNDNAVYDLFSDNKSNIWVGTYYGGINLYNNSYGSFTTYKRGKAKDNISGNVVRQIVENDKGDLWIALEDGGLNYYDKKNQVFHHYFTDYKIDYYNIHSLILDDNVLWVSTFEQGLLSYVIDSELDKAPVLKPKNKSLEDEINFVITKDREGNIWSGTNNGIYVIDSVTEKITNYKPEVFRNKMVYSMCWIDSTQALIGTLRNGLYLFDTQTNFVKSFSTSVEFSALYTVSCITKMNDSLVAIASSDGLYIYDISRGCLWNELPYSLVNEARAILGDKVLWISTIDGLLYYNRLNGEIRKFRKDYGLPDNQFNFNSAFEASDGVLFFGSYNGLVSFKPSEIPLTDIELNIKCVNYKILDKKRERLATFNLKKKNEKIILKPFQSYISLSFSTFNFMESDNIEYSMKISDGEWEEIPGRTVSFTNLSSGKHSLKVKAHSADIESNVLEILIYKKPPFVRSLFAYIVYGVVLILLMFFSRRRIEQNLKKKNILDFERYEKEKMKELNEQKLHFFLNISHEFRTPITIISGIIQNLIKNNKIEKAVKEKIKLLERNAVNLNRLVGDFLEYGKLESGYKPLIVHQHTVLDMISETCDMFEEWAEIHAIEFHRNISEDKAQGYADTVKLERILYNLLSNAFKYNRDGGSVTINASVTGERKLENRKLLIEIKDTGIGIPSDLQEKIFEYFEREIGTKEDGTGIGLAYVGGLVKQHLGSIELHSKKGIGSAFSLSFPIEKKNYLPETISQISTNNTINRLSKHQSLTNYKEVYGVETILVIDDNLDILSLLKEMLEEHFNIITTGNPKDAISIVERKNPTIIITDLMMPEMDGFELVEALQDNLLTSHIPIIVLSAAAEKGNRLSSYKKGAVSFISKPFEEEELLSSICSILNFRKEIIRRFQGNEDITVNTIVLSSQDEEFVTKAIDFINDNIENSDLSIKDFCEKMNVSRTLLHNKIKKITGMSTSAFIRYYRLKKAYVYLKKEKLTISEVAYKCGFKSPDYFSKCFKSQYNHSPSEV